MEPQDTIYCCVNDQKECNNGNCKCIRIVIFVLVALFLATLGLILGAVFATTLLENLAVLILAAVLLALLAILTIIFKICICRKRKKC